MRLRACLLAIAVVLPIRAFAQTPPPAAPPPPAPPAEAAPPAPVAAPAPAPAAVVVAPAPVPPPPPAAAPSPKFVFGGLVDTYYLFNFIRADGANTLTPPVGRAFDTAANSLTLALAKLTMNASLDVVSLQLDLGYGSDGAIINAAGAGSTGQGNILVEQAYGEISLPGNLTLDFGKFTTTAGAEVIEANKNWLYSRSFLFNAIPLLHTGARANLKINDMLTLQASLVNGWNNDPDSNAWKTGGLSASITASPMLSIIATTYFGKESPQGAAASTPGDLRFLFDLVAALTLNDKFGLNLNVDYIKAPSLDPTVADNGSDYQIGAAIMGRYVVSDHLYVSARGEFLSSHLDAAAHTTTVEEGTLMAGIPVGKNFELRPEVRADFSGDDVYAGGTKKNQFTGELAALTFF
jgi:Putative beta-barrel porin-2, OmpL-like. bbp2